MDTRERLLEAAIRLLQERGYARTTTRRIVAAADSHLPAVNYYFGSKERLLEEAIVEALRRWARSTMSVAEEPDQTEPGARLRGGLKRFLSTLERDRPYAVAALEAFAQAERSEQLRERLAAAYSEFREEVADSITTVSGGSSDGPAEQGAEAVATVLIALFDGLAIQCLLDPQHAPSSEDVLWGLAAVGQAVEPAPGR